MDDKLPKTWQRPAGPLNVWKIIESTEKLSDGSTRPIRFSIQEVPVDRREETIDFMLKYYIPDEPICKSLNCKNDPDMIHDFQVCWKYCLEEGSVEAAYVLGSDGSIGELVALNMLYVSSKANDQKIFQLMDSFKSSKFKALAKIMLDAKETADCSNILGVDEYISAIGLAVATHLRGQKLGLRLLEARSEMGKKFGIKGTSTTFTAKASQILATRAGFEEKFSWNYADILNDDGTPFFPNIETENFKIMTKKF
ncbi:hypothetical protein TKK_0007774 [Trichogramma kaykai]|uniref:N-acetyltransferase domain-containing protein n=1 Tax=Trichogramma kaykai TaxID=54128 RepID=A0ABD2X6S8_9HYME